MARCAIKSCRAEFVRRSMTHKTCSPECAQEYVRQEKEKRKNKEYREKKQALKTRSDHIKEAQVAFNAYIRERDKHLPCICCGRPLTESAIGGGYDCGHYRSTGSAPHLRFDERNAHAQRKHCNRYRAGNAVDYRLGLIDRIGVDQVEALESENTPRKFTIEELIEIKKTYQAKLTALRKAKKQSESF